MFGTSWKRKYKKTNRGFKCLFSEPSYKICTIAKWNNITNLGVKYFCKGKLKLLQRIINQKFIYQQNLQFIKPYSCIMYHILMIFFFITFSNILLYLQYFTKNVEALVSSSQDLTCILSWSNIVTKDDYYCLELDDGQYGNICMC